MLVCSPLLRRTIYLTFYALIHPRLLQETARHVSTTAAINKGLRAQRDSAGRSGPGARRRTGETYGVRKAKGVALSAPRGVVQDTLVPPSEGAAFRGSKHQPSRGGRHRPSQTRHHRVHELVTQESSRPGENKRTVKTRRGVTKPRTREAATRTAKPRAQPASASDAGKDKSDHDIPIHVPYTTAASEFLYGAHTVLAALRSGRRRLYHLYVSPRAFNGPAGLAEILHLAKSAGLPTEKGTSSRFLDKLSEGRPHNGVALEAGRIPAPPVLAMGKPDLKTNLIPLNLDRQSAEDVAVNDAPAAIPTATTRSWRCPFVLFLDGIVDEGNIGSILRTAHFYGVDAVAIAKTCAPLNSPIMAKASSGACESVCLLAVPKPASFIFNSAKAGWHIYAAVAPQAETLSHASADQARKYISTAEVVASSPLAKQPCILMLGAEGEGLRANLVSKADHLLSIERGSKENDGINVGVDSLNVGVAAGVLMEGFLRMPAGATANTKAGGDLGF